MNKYIIFSDYHIGFPWPLKPDFCFSKNTVFLGDNFEIQYALKTQLKKIKKLRNEIIKKCERAKGIYVSGNHSLEPLTNKLKLIAVRKKILFTHGDIVAWRYKKAHKCRSGTPGVSKLHWLVVMIYRMIFSGDELVLRKRHVKRAVALAKQHKCKTIVMGHFHTGNNILEMRKHGVRIVVVPRGKSEVLL